MNVPREDEPGGRRPPEDRERTPIPDDASALRELAAQVRVELEAERRRERRERRAPYLLLAAALAVTLLSLLSMVAAFVLSNGRAEDAPAPEPVPAETVLNDAAASRTD